MPIPKIVHQTHPTCVLPKPAMMVRKNMQYLNPEYKFVLYDDNEIDNFMKTFFSGEVYECFSALKVGAAKADLWRYCILYHVGGIYLDIDSRIIDNIDSLISKDDKCIITREKQPSKFNQWILIFEKNHPIMKRAIEICCENIKLRKKGSIINITGPGVYTNAINDILLDYVNKYPIHNYKTLYDISDETINKLSEQEDFPAKCKFYGFDIEPYARFKYPGFMELYECEKDNTILHWAKQKSVYK